VRRSPTLVCLRLLLALGCVGRILHRATPITAGPLRATARRCHRIIGLPRPVPLLISNRASVPFTWGWRRPRIILPAGCAGWSERKLAVILLHEMAHIKRWDALTTGVTELAAIVYWFNPLLWLARRQMLVERECASDDCVLTTGVKASEYAGYLLEIARVIRGRRWLPELQVAMARKTKLEERIMAIVNKDRQPSGFTPRPRLLVATLVAMLLVVPLASFQLFASNAHEPADTGAATTDMASPATLASAATSATPTTPASPATAATPRELETITALLNDFHAALYEGDDYEDVLSRFLTRDYFEDPELSFENWTQQRRDELIHNTIALLVGVENATAVEQDHDVRLLESLPIRNSRLVYRAEPVACRKRDGEYQLTRRVNIHTEGPPAERRHLVRDLVQTIVFVEEKGALRISRYDGGVNIQRMDVDNPYGPIFIVTIDGDKTTAPTGPLLFKSIPRSIVPGNLSMIPLRPDTTAQ
jgi:hypothetical protein